MHIKIPVYLKKGDEDEYWIIVFFLLKIEVVYSESFNNAGNIMLDKIQTKIDALAQGKKLILGSGVAAEDMQKIIHFCENLASSGQIKIVKVNQDHSNAKVLTHSIMVQKQ